MDLAAVVTVTQPVPEPLTPHSAHLLSHIKLWLGTPILDEWENR